MRSGDTKIQSVTLHGSRLHSNMGNCDVTHRDANKTIRVHLVTLKGCLSLSTDWRVFVMTENNKERQKVRSNFGITYPPPGSFLALPLTVGLNRQDNNSQHFGLCIKINKEKFDANNEIMQEKL